MRLLAASSQEWVERGWVYASWEGKEKELGEREAEAHPVYAYAYMREHHTTCFYRALYDMRYGMTNERG